MLQTSDSWNYIELPSGFRIYDIPIEVKEAYLKRKERFTLKDWLIISYKPILIMFSVFAIWVINS